MKIGRNETFCMERKGFFPQISKRILQVGLFCLGMGAVTLAHSAVYGPVVPVMTGAYNANVQAWDCPSCIEDLNYQEIIMVNMKIEALQHISLLPHL